MKHDYFIEWFDIHVGIRYTTLNDCIEKELNDFVDCLKIQATQIKISVLK
jgi:hypothetical protein